MYFSQSITFLLAVCLVSCAKELATRPVFPQPTASSSNPIQSKPLEEQLVLPPAPALPSTPAGLPDMSDTARNPTTPEKADLGQRLFFDKRLSRDGSMACVACHHIEKAYTSGQMTDMKVGGAMNTRNAPSMLNVGYHMSFYWEGRKPTLEAVSHAAWTAQLGARPSDVVVKLNQVPIYRALFQRAFQENATPDNVPKALAAWLRALKSGNSPWDRAQAGALEALPKLASVGYKLFQDKGCVHCHVPPHFTDFDFHNVGRGDDLGRMRVTKDKKDTGKFKTPSLRNVALTAPYFHDGTVFKLEKAITLMASPKHGKKNKYLDAKLKIQRLSKKEVMAIKAFLESLTGDSTYVTPPQLP